MNKPPYIPKEGIVLPFFDTAPKTANESREVKGAIERMTNAVDKYLNRLILNHRVNDINKECCRRMIPKPDGWLEKYFIHGKCVLVTQFITAGDNADFVISEPQKKDNQFQA